jgi:SAM-dependent methyltransferase
MRDIKGIIKSENPNEHWGFLNVKDKIVLDLGCGINSEFAPTPWYFINDKKAKYVVGVDSSQPSYDWFKQNFVVKNFISIMDWVDRWEKIQMYIDYWKPEVIKMDIEGSEILMGPLDDRLFDNVNEVAIEYHNLACLLTIENKLKQVGFQLKYYKFEHLDIDYQGVLYAHK